MKNKQTYIIMQTVAALAAIMVFVAMPSAFAASQTWNGGGADANWTTSGNWVGNAVPGAANAVSGDTATFNAALVSGTKGGVANPVIPDNARTVKFILFDTANAGAYVIGTAGGNQLLLNQLGNVTLNSSVAASQVINAPFSFKLPSSNDGQDSFINNASSPSVTLTFAGVTNTAGSRGVTLTLDGSNTGNNTVQHLSDNGTAFRLIKQGAGKWILSSATTQWKSGSNGGTTAGIAINAGTLEIQNAGAFFTALTPVISGGTLQIDGVTPTSPSFTLGGTSGGTILENGSSTVNTVAIATATASSATFSTTSASDVLTIGNAANRLSGGASDTVLHIAGPGTVFLATNTTYAGTWSLDAGTNKLGNALSLGPVTTSVAFGTSSTATLWLNGFGIQVAGLNCASTPGTPTIENRNATAAVLTNNNASANTFAGVIQDGAGGGALSLFKSGVGTLTLSGANTYSGGTTVSGGTLNVANASGSGTGSGTVTVASGATLTGSGTIGGNLVLQSGAIPSLTNGTLLTVSGTATLNNNQVTVNVVGSPLTTAGSPFTLLTATGGFTGGSTVNIAPVTTGIAGGYYGAISLSGNSIIMTVYASAAPTTWTDGNSTGNWSDAGNWSGSVPSVAGDTAVFGTGASPVSLDVPESVGALSFTNTGSYVISGGNTLTLDNNGFGATIGVTGGTANDVQTAVSLKDNTVANVSSGDSLKISGVVANTSGARTLTFNGNGTAILANANTYGPASAGTVGTTLSAGGTLQVGNNTALGAGDVSVTASSTLQAGAASLSVANNIAVNPGSTATVDNNTYDLSLGGVISGGGSLSKVNNGALTLGSANTYAGSTTINGGTLNISADTSLGTAPLSVTANSILLGGGDLLASSGNPILVANRGITLNNTGLIDAAGGQTLTVYGIIAGNHDLTVNSAGNTGTVMLGGADSFNGTTVITAGTLELTNSLALQNSILNYSSGSLTFAPGITAATIAQLTGSQTLPLSNLAGTPLGVALTTGGNNASWTYAGALSGNGSLVKVGTGNLELTGANSYTNATTINAGILQLDTGGVINGGPGALNNAQFIVNGGSYSGTSFGLSAPSAGLLMSSGSMTLSGALTANNGNSSQASTDAPIIANGGTLTAASLSMGRTAQSATTQPAAGYTASGIYVNGGAVNISGNVSLGTQGGANSTASARIDSGSLNVTGTLTFGLNNGGRWSVVNVNGGSLTVGDTTTGMTLGSTFAGNTEFLITNGTAALGKVSFGQGAIAESNILQQTGGTLYIGSGGMAKVTSDTGSASATINLDAGILGATADWSNGIPMNLRGTTFTIQAGDASGTAHNILLTGVLQEQNTTALIKSGLGTLTLSGANQQLGGTVISNGTLNINGIFALGGANYNGLTITNGSTLQYSTNSTGNGSLDLTSIGTAGVTLGTGADVIDVNGNTVAYASPIGNGGSGGLTVQSTVSGGVLNLLTNNDYLGNTLVANGATLKANNTTGSATAGGTVTVQSGGTLGGNGIITGAVEIQSGGILAPGNSVGTNTVGSLTLDSGAVGDIEFNGSGNDQTVVTGGLTVSGGIFNLYYEGSTVSWSVPGAYTLVQYTGANPVLDGTWTTVSSSNPHVGNPQSSLTYSFTASSGKLTLTIGLSGSTVSGLWTNTATSGSWATAANWSSNPNTPHAPGDLAQFGNGTSLTTVTLDGSKSVGSLTFNNNNSYQIAPGTGGTLTLNNNGSGIAVNVTAGTANQINTPVALSDNAVLSAQGGKSLAISGNIQNSTSAKTVTVNSLGTVTLSGNNSYGPGAGGYGTILTGGSTLQVGSGTALGASDVSFAGNSTLQAGTSTALANNIDVSPGVTATVDTAGQTLSMNGALNDSGNLTKIGNGTLALPDNVANNFTGITTVNGGVLSLAYEGDLYQSTQIILNGGDLLGNGQSDNGFAVVIDPPIGIGPALGAVGGTALLDATSGSTLTLGGLITSAGNTGANNVVVNSGAGNNGTVYMGVDGNTYNGTTVISNGLLWVASSLPLAYTTLDYSNQGGFLVVDGSISSITLGGLEGAQDFGLTNLNGNALSLSVGQNNASTTYSGNLSDPAAGGGLTKVGTGTLTLAGTNSYVLPTTISGGVLRINTNGVLNTVSASVPAVGGAQLVVSGGALTVTNTSNIGSISAGLLVSAGSATFLGPLTTTLNTAQGDLIAVTGGSLQAASLALGRTGLSDTTQPVAGSTTGGLYVNGGAVNILGNLDMSTSASVQSSANTRIDSGSLTVGGVVTIGLNNGGRWSVLDVNGGSLMVTNVVTGISIGGPNAGNAELLIRSGTVTAGIIGLGNAADLSTNSDTAVLNMTNGSLYVGAGGIVQVQASTNLTPVITLSGGLLGAVTNWSCTNNIQFTGVSYIIQTADSSGNPQNIYLGGTNSGGAELIKSGAGTLVLSNADVRTGATTISNGTLALVPGAQLAATPQIGIVSGATFDVSALTGFTLTGSPVQTLAGVSSSGTANVNATGNAMTLAPGATGLLNAIGGGSPTVGKITVAGGLTLSGNTITVNVNGGILGAGNYRLLDCTGNLTGSASNTPAFTGLGATPGAPASVSTTTGAAGHVDLTLGKATPALQTAVASTITNGATLGQSTLFVTFTNTAGGNVPGTYAFTSPGTIPPVGTAGYPVQFTPNDTANYNTPAPFNVNVTVLPSVLIPTQSAGITGISMVDGNVVINGTNGETGGTYYLLETTNVADPISQWKAVATNVVSTNGPSGAFTFTGTNTVTSDGVQQFYILSNTNNQ